MSASRFYVTTPIYYVNDRPHIGHSYTTILADVLSRYHRFFGDEVRFMTGTDEHGQKVQQSAEARGVSPQEQCDEYSQRFKDMWETLGIQYDRFIRTTEKEHRHGVQAIVQKLYEQGDIYPATYSGWYHIGDELFISDDDVTEEGKASGRIIWLEEKNYFFRLSKYADWLKNYLENENPTFIQPDVRRNEILGLLRQGVSDLCISRPKSRLSWGIEFPFDTDFVIYVWIDALTNYITGLGWPEGQDYAKWWSSCVHLIGKDILKQHGLFWPILLHALDIPLPQKIMAHGWWTRGGQKESKTVTKALAEQLPVRHIQDLVAEYGAEPIRYFLMREMVVGQDQDYSEEILVQRLNSDLANDLGNLVSRVTRIVQQSFDGKVPPMRSHLPDGGLRAKVETLRDEVQEHVNNLKTHLVVQCLLDVVRQTNNYIATEEPWKKIKQGEKEAAGHTLAVALNVLHQVGLLLYPIMPKKMEQLLRQIGSPATLPYSVHQLGWNQPPEGSVVPAGEPLFPRLDWSEIQKRIQSSSSTEEKVVQEADNLISIEEFGRVDLRLAKVLSAERVPKADKLLRLQIELGEEKRQIIAGIAEYYAPEDVVGKKIVVVANLKPARIRGFESCGMLLAAKDGKQLRIITVDGEVMESGAKVG